MGQLPGFFLQKRVLFHDASKKELIFLDRSLPKGGKRIARGNGGTTAAPGNRGENGAPRRGAGESGRKGFSVGCSAPPGPLRGPTFPLGIPRAAVVPPLPWAHRVRPSGARNQHLNLRSQSCVSASKLSSGPGGFNPACFSYVRCASAFCHPPAPDKDKGRAPE